MRKVKEFCSVFCWGITKFLVVWLTKLLLMKCYKYLNKGLINGVCWMEFLQQTWQVKQDNSRGLLSSLEAEKTKCEECGYNMIKLQAKDIVVKQYIQLVTYSRIIYYSAFTKMRCTRLVTVQVNLRRRLVQIKLDLETGPNANTLNFYKNWKQLVSKCYLTFFKAQFTSCKF